jgi:hypothetical protein
MRPLKISLLVFLFIAVSSLPQAGARVGRVASARAQNGARLAGGSDEQGVRARDGSRAEVSAAGLSSGPLPSRDRQINSAYLDAAAILSGENECSRFFGGPGAALEVLTRLAGRLRKTTLPPGVGIRMYGPVTDFSDAARGLRYRLFEKALVNATGPFSTSRRFPSEAPARNVGSFLADTREARVLMLLHEIGHLISGPDNNWLLPNDGGDDVQSEKNTRFVESKCGEQIRALRSR